MAKKIYKAEPTMKQLPKRIKAVEKSAVTAKPKPSAVATTGKIKIRNVKVSTSGGPKPKTSVSGTSMISGTKVKNPTPKPTAKATKKPMTASEKAFIKNQKEKEKATKRTGVYPNTAN
jgi:hypothetical protein